VRRPSLMLVAALGVVLVGACSPAAASPSPVPAATGSAAGSDIAAAEAYCTDQGGMLVDRVATWNVNADSSAWLELAGRMRLCEFESGEGDTTTRISVDLVTLYSEEPTLAGLAYLSKLPPTLPEGSVNPAAFNCMEGLYGTSQFGNAPAAGGGWVDQSQPVFEVMSLCMFADGSAIDEWGITYYATGAIRGADLATKMRYRPSGPLPAVFADGSGG
jgi:putative hemolysin